MEGALIYGNEEIIFEEINKVKESIENLDCKTFQEDCNSLEQDVNKFVKEISNVKLATPEILLENKGADFTDMVKIESKILIFGVNTSSVGIFNLVSKDYKQIQTTATGFIDANTPKENDYSLFLTNNNELYKFDNKTDEIKQIEIYYLTDDINIRSIFVYNRNLYTLDVANGNIYKHVAIQAGFGKGTVWNKQSENLDGGVGLTIDGDIFVVKASGEIIKMAGGEKQNFAINHLFPPLENAEKIWTYNNINYLYILDKENKRLVLIDKEGEFSKQITAKEFESPTGMAVEEDKNISYIVSSGNLYKIDL